MKKRMEKASKEKGNSGVEEEPNQTAGLNIQDKCPVQSFNDYQCSGRLDVDFPELCALVGLEKNPDVRPITAVSPPTERATESNQEQSFSESCMTAWSPEPCLQMELENEDTRSVKRVRISGWRVNEPMSRVLSKTLPSLSNLQSLEMWRAGLTDSVLTSIKDTISLCSKLRRVILEGTPIPENTYHILLGDNSMITHLSLRNNRIGEEGARLISSALSKNLLSLNMACNTVGDVGAVYLAQALRLNRALLYLSLASNHITDVGAAHLAQVFGPFALTHKEIVERRRLTRKDQLNATKRDEKLQTNQTVSTPGKKEDPKEEKRKTSDTKMSQGRGGKSDGKDKHDPLKEQEAEEALETHSLLDPAIQHIGGEVIHPGNTTLLSLNLSGNKLTQQSLQVFLSSVERQGKRGLQYISLTRNSFSSDCKVFLKLQEMMSLKDPLNRTGSDPVESEQGEA